MIPASWSPLAAGARFTQPRVHSLVCPRVNESSLSMGAGAGGRHRAGKSQLKVVCFCSQIGAAEAEGGREERSWYGMRKLGESADSEVGSGSIGFFSRTNGYASLLMTKGNQNWKGERRGDDRRSGARTEHV